MVVWVLVVKMLEKLLSEKEFEKIGLEPTKNYYFGYQIYRKLGKIFFVKKIGEEYEVKDNIDKKNGD